MEKEYIEYPTGYNNAGGRNWSKKAIDEIEEKDKLDCPECKNKNSEDCIMCDGRGWVYSGQEWEYSCECGSSTARANCYENADIYCECMND